MSDRLNANGQITVWTRPNSDQILTSQGTDYNLILQSDGKLTIWAGMPEPNSGTPLWSSNSTKGTASRAIMQADGNFVVYDTSNTALWSSDTSGHSGAYVDDGFLVVYDPTNLPLWASESKVSSAVMGTQQLVQGAAGVMGVSHDNYGVFGHSKNSDAIHGQTDSNTRAGVWGECGGNGDGVHGQSNGTGAAVAGVAMGSGPAGFFNGDVNVTGKLSGTALSTSAIDFTQPSKGEVSSSAVQRFFADEANEEENHEP
jgi:hypothetical protein